MDNSRSNSKNAFNIENIEKYAKKLNESEVTITSGEYSTNFKINKLLAMDAFDLLEDIRPSVGMGITAILGKGLPTTTILAMILNLPKNTFSNIKSKLFQGVSFTNTNMKSPTILAGNEDVAFNGLEALDIYQIFFRAFVVNFFSQFNVLLSHIAPLEQDSK